MIPQGRTSLQSRKPIWFPPVSSKPCSLSTLHTNGALPAPRLKVQQSCTLKKSPDSSTGSDSGEGSDLSPSPTLTGDQDRGFSPLDSLCPNHTASLFVETEFTTPSAPNRSSVRLDNCAVSSDTGSSVSQCSSSSPLQKRNPLYPLQTAYVLTAPYQSLPVPEKHVFLYTWTLAAPNILAKLAAIDLRCFTNTEQAFGLLFSKPISKSDYVCRIPLYLTRGMTRARVRLIRRLLLTDDQLKLILSAHHIVAELLTNIADLSHVGLRHSDLRLRSVFEQKTTDPNGVSVRNAYTELEFDPVASRALCLVCIMNVKTGELDLEATKLLLEWNNARRDWSYETHQSRVQPVHGIVPIYSVRLSQLPVHNWAGLMVRPCQLPADDPAMFAISGPSQKTGLDQVPSEWADKVFATLQGSESTESTTTPSPILSYFDYFAIRSPSILELIENSDPRLPLATCFRLTRHQNAAQAVAGMRKDKRLRPRGPCALYLADACAVHPLSAWLWFLMSVLPVVMYQLTRAVAAVELSDLLVSALRDPSAIRPTTAHTVLLPDRIDKPRCMLSELNEFTDVDFEVQESTSLDDLMLDDRACPVIIDERASRPADLLEATTLLASRDAVNLERLELLGDSFLQLIGTLSVYSGSSASADEGYLTAKRVSLVSNSNLCKIALRLGWTKYCTGQAYSPPDHFLFPCYTVPRSAMKFEFDSRLHIKLTDKSLADMMEALIGCLHQHLGPPAAFRLICFLGISADLERHVDPVDGTWCKLFHTELSPTRSRSRLSAVRGMTRSRSMLQFTEKSSEDSPPMDLDTIPVGTFTEVMDRFSSQLVGLQKLLGYQFTDIKLLIRALIHPSSSYTELFGSYQRHSQEQPSRSPDCESIRVQVVPTEPRTFGLRAPFELDPDWFLLSSYEKWNVKLRRLTESRANIVSNNSLACAVVEHKIHRFIYHSQPSFDAAVSYLNFILERTTCFAEQLELINQAVLKGLRIKTLADVFESILGAVFVDTRGSLEVVSGIIHHFLDDRIHDYLKNNPINPLKSLHRLYPDLKYTDMEVLTPEHSSSRFKLCATVSGKQIYSYGVTRDAARLALAERLRVPLKSIADNSG
ncbi:unnamed protein product [Dicrocoelium dendriticum]|nr:unnamed protein product [Dicrocoelium dendriticum]